MDPLTPSVEEKKLMAEQTWEETGRHTIIEMELDSAIREVGEYNKAYCLNNNPRQIIFERTKFLLSNINQKNIGLSYPEHIHDLEGKVMDCVGKANQVVWKLKQINHIDMSNLDESINKHIVRSLGCVQIGYSTRSTISQAVRNDIADQWIQCHDYIIDMELFGFLQNGKKGFNQPWDCSSFFSHSRVEKRTQRYIKNINEICEYPECINGLEEKIKRCVHDVRDIVWDLEQISSEYDSKKHESVDLFIHRRIDLCLECHDALRTRDITRSMLELAVWIDLDKISNASPTSTTTSAFTTTSIAAAAAAASDVTTTTTITPNPTSAGTSPAVTLPLAQRGMLVTPETAFLPLRTNAPCAFKIPRKVSSKMFPAASAKSSSGPRPKPKPETSRKRKRKRQQSSGWHGHTRHRGYTPALMVLVMQAYGFKERKDWHCKPCNAVPPEVVKLQRDDINFYCWYGSSLNREDRPELEKLASNDLTMACLEEISSKLTTEEEMINLADMLDNVDLDPPIHPNFSFGGAKCPTLKEISQHDPNALSNLEYDVKFYFLQLWLLNMIATKYVGVGFALVTQTLREIGHGDYNRFVDPKSRQPTARNSIQVPIFLSNNREDVNHMEHVVNAFAGPTWTSLNQDHGLDTVNKCKADHPFHGLMVVFQLDIPGNLDKDAMAFVSKALLSTRPHYVLSTDPPPKNSQDFLLHNYSLLHNLATQLDVQDWVPWKLLMRIES